jgi:hypothetical protein
MSNKKKEDIIIRYIIFNSVENNFIEKVIDNKPNALLCLSNMRIIDYIKGGLEFGLFVKDGKKVLLTNRGKRMLKSYSRAMKKGWKKEAFILANTKEKKLESRKT